MIIECNICEGAGKLSICCHQPASPVYAQVSDYIKDGQAYVVMASHDNYVCSACNKFCKVFECKGCKGTGVN